MLRTAVLFFCSAASRVENS